MTVIPRRKSSLPDSMSSPIAATAIIAMAVATEPRAAPSTQATPLAITLLPGGSVSDWAEEYFRTPGRFITDNLITMQGLEQGTLATLRSCNCTDFDLAAARGEGYRLIDDGRGGHGRSVTMGGAKSKIMGAAGAIAGLFHAASAHAQEFADPAGSGVLVSAVRWLEGTLLGTIATVIAVTAVATVGFMKIGRAHV